MDAQDMTDAAMVAMPTSDLADMLGMFKRMHDIMVWSMGVIEDAHTEAFSEGRMMFAIGRVYETLDNECASMKDEYTGLYNRWYDYVRRELPEPREDDP